MKKIYNGLLFFIMTFMLMLCVSNTSNAKDYTLATSNQWVSGSIAEEGQNNFYYITLPKAGYLTVVFQGWSVGDAYYKLVNADSLESYYCNEVYTSSNTNPKTSTDSRWLEAGSYYVQVYPYGEHTGNYKLKASFLAANNNETEPNNGFEQAMRLPKGTLVDGLISMDDSLDTYRIDLTKNTTICLSIVSRINDIYAVLWDSDFKTIYQKEIYYASESNPKNHVDELTLNAGTYYLQIKPYSIGSNNTGRYSLKYIDVQKVSAIGINGNKKVVAGNSFQLSATISPSNATNKAVSWSSDNTSIATVDEKTGKVTTVNPGTAHIMASAQDNGGAKKSITIIVLPKKVTGMSVKKYYNMGSSLYVSWNSQYHVAGYQVQYSTNKKFKSAKIKTATYNGKGLLRLKRHKKYYVRTRSYIKVGKKKYYGSWSKVKSCKTK